MTVAWKKRCDNNHLGHFFVDYMRKNGNAICQIDAATGEEESCASVLSRSIRLAQCFGKLGLVPGDTMVIGGRNHLDVHIPFYAGMISGLPVSGIDPALKSNELKCYFNIVKPKIAFCENAMYEEYKHTIQEEGHNTKIVTFGAGDNSLDKLMETYQDLQPQEEFQVAIFNTDEVYCWLASTSGSTGRPKVVALTHSHLLQMLDFFRIPPAKNGLRRTALNLSTLHWLSGLFNALLMPIHHIKVQTSTPVTTELVIDIINKYKPAGTLFTPTLIAPVLHHENHCDLTCFDILKIGGSKIHSELLSSLKARLREDTVIYLAYGQTEIGGLSLESFSEESLTVANVIGTNEPKFEIKIVSPETGKEILEPNVTGELHVRGPRMACYYNDPKETESVFTEDGFLKTGDLFYKTEHGRYVFVERLKMLLKYKNYQVIPPEVEKVILTHPGVADVCVTGVPHPDDGEHIVACVVRRPGYHISAGDIKELVAKHLSPSKHLHGGVVFLDTLPTTASGKVARLQVKKLVLSANRE
ncbi:4-coumarate--CoA ligase 1-like isoform X1 [Leguminivora glycinivorella]|uniref:4-coumarate--CoA ligase 1-like isoform X1 n=1 Tax=Leguminivora glycinivorella TaxID=1035111 RepID=UPI00200CEFE2|nr:4-coumarate--CoA ligase 1-like isoform X1 [Leguminivora glycinivorella]